MSKDLMPSAAGGKQKKKKYTTQELLDSIVLAPDERLQTKCEPVTQITPEIKELANRMLQTMYAADGCGLAAPQIGELIQLIVIDVDPKGKTPYVLINPKIITADGPVRTFTEGCLSFPGVSVDVERPSHVVVQALDLNGDLLQYEARDNLLANCLQHEIDHVMGVTMFDHLKLADKARATKEYQDALEHGARPGETSIEE